MIPCARTSAARRRALSAGVARDSAGRWRHPVRPHRVRTDLDVQKVPTKATRPRTRDLSALSYAWLHKWSRHAMSGAPTARGRLASTGHARERSRPGTW
ncbi:hypothetical protein EES42_35340 [Streptomyces sp. ADI95-17]|nr:hypothetical protein EES42_35340 [Streptomyces sp. ADI95-17]